MPARHVGSYCASEQEPVYVQVRVRVRQVERMSKMNDDDDYYYYYYHQYLRNQIQSLEVPLTLGAGVGGYGAR